MKKLILLFAIATFSASTQAVTLPKITITKTIGEWFLVDQVMPPENELVRTYVDEEENSQKAIWKNGDWYYPSGLKLLPWTPVYWQYL